METIYILLDNEGQVQRATMSYDDAQIHTAFGGSYVETNLTEATEVEMAYTPELSSHEHYVDLEYIEDYDCKIVTEVDHDEWGKALVLKGFYFCKDGYCVNYEDVNLDQETKRRLELELDTIIEKANYELYNS